MLSRIDWDLVEGIYDVVIVFVIVFCIFKAIQTQSDDIINGKDV